MRGGVDAHFGAILTAYPALKDIPGNKQHQKTNQYIGRQRISMPSLLADAICIRIDVRIAAEKK